MKKLCEYCHQPFEAKSSRVRFCNREHILICPVCKSKRPATSKQQLATVLDIGPITCSYPCRVAKTQATSMERYGCKAPGNNSEARKKASETMMEHLGVPYAMMSQVTQEKSKITLQERLGVDNAGKSEKVKEKRKQTNKERYGDVMPFNRPESYEKQHRTIRSRYNVPYASMIPRVAKSNGRKSTFNTEFAKKLENIGETVKTEEPLECFLYDLYLPERNILIEINPTYTHNVIGNHWAPEGIDKYYHRDKSKIAIENGFKCIHVWDWDDSDAIVQYICPRNRMDCNKLEIFKLTSEATSEFMSKNDLQGDCRNQILSLGLVKDGVIYQCITFGKCKYDNKYNIQLMRMTTKLDWEIEGGFNRLTEYASKYFEITECIAYVDVSKIIDTRYEDVGMKLDHINPPSKIWSKNKKWIADSLVKDPHTKYEESTLLNEGWLPIYNCGQFVFTVG